MLIASQQGWAQKEETRDWMLGITLPFHNVEFQSSAKNEQIWTGLSAAYKGFTLNLYASFGKSTDYVQISELKQVIREGDWEWAPQFTIGYQYTFGLNHDSPFKPVVGAYCGNMYEIDDWEHLDFDFDIGLQYQNFNFLLSPHIRSIKKGVFIPLSDVQERKIYLKFKLQYRLG